jgi:t-SNARE complex subunit (syntaxin)
VKSYGRLRIGNAHYSLSQDSYIQSRSTAIESIESTIAELGQIFTQLAQMVAEQRETVQRIDADTVDIASNVSGAQRELLKYYASISSNRWLMLKVFGVLIVFVSPSNFHVYRKFDTTTVPYLHLGVLRHQSTTYHYMHILFA